MIGAFEQYHGAALRELIVCAPDSITIKPCDQRGRVNSFLLNDRIGLHIKHSAKRLPPWQFTFNDENVSELEALNKDADQVWIVMVCGQDGTVAISLEDFQSINPVGHNRTCFVRVDRDRRTQYRVNGSGNCLSYKPPRGLAALIAELFDDKTDA